MILKMLKPSFFAVVVCSLAVGTFAQTPGTGPGDILIADFEGEDYGDWTVEGEAFGKGPARGTLNGQMPVSGFLGQGLVNSFFNGDGTTGKLTSPGFKIERKYINFLIGGGGHTDLTCINLLVDGEKVRSTTGPNLQGGGTEALDWAAWEVGEFRGKEARIEIVDAEKGGWGHINIDQIFQSDRKLALDDAARDFKIEKRFLHLPVKKGCRKVWLQVLLDGKFQQEFEIELADSNDIDFFATFEVARWKGKTITLRAERYPGGEKSLEKIVASNNYSDEPNLYKEKLRPQFHFSPLRGWTNDPNGMMYYDGEYHLFFQHNPFSVDWGNMTWGHAVSKDMLHWEELPDALLPDKLGTIFSGSGVVDKNNTSGFQTGKEKPLVVFYTSAGECVRPRVPYTQSIAYSNDRGRSWTKYEGNPVIPHIENANRDPKVFWHEPSNAWVLALYLDREDYALFSSKNLKDWEKICDITNLGCSECPDMFELAVDGDPNNKKWVFWGGDGNYLIGSFDGKAFQKESGPFRSKYGGNDYAAQTFSDIPEKDGRRIQIAWMQGGEYPGMPFNQQMSIPRVLTLRTAKDGVRLFMEPIEEVRGLSRRHYTGKIEQPASENVLGLIGLRDEGFSISDLYDLDLEFDTAAIPAGDRPAESFGVLLCGRRIEYDVAKKEISLDGIKAPLELDEGKLSLRILTDRTSIELFANGGIVQIAKCFVPTGEPGDQPIKTFANGGTVGQKWELRMPRSVWK